MCQSRHSSVAIEVGAYAHMLYAHDVHGMVYVLYGIKHGGFGVLAQESLVEGHLHHTTLAGKAFHLPVGEVAGMVAKAPATGMAAHYGNLGDVHGIVETLFRSMAEVHHHAQAVHLSYHVGTELTYSAVLVAALSGRVADVVVTIVAKGHVHHSPLAEVFYLCKVMTYGITVLYAQHDGLLAFVLQAVEVVGSVCQPHLATVRRYRLLYLGDDAVGLGRCCQVCLAGTLVLRQVCHHYGGIQVSVPHARQGDKPFFVRAELHGRVAMGVQREYAAMHLLCLGIVA